MKKATIERIRKFTSDRDWDQFHSPANLAKSISIEANELLECFQWSESNFDIKKVKEELADVMVYCRNMLDKLDLDEDEIINDKMDKNEMKYPVSLSRGNSKKYTDLVIETGEVYELDEVDITILSFIKSIGPRFGEKSIVSVLHGGESAKIAKHKLNESKFYCALKMKSDKKNTSAKIESLIEKGYLFKNDSFYSCIGLTDKGEGVLSKI